MKTVLVLCGSLLAGALIAQPAKPADPGALKAKAYELYEAQRLTEAAAQFQAYLANNVDDAKALYDYASLLVQLNRHQDAAQQLERLHQTHPDHEVGYFKLGVEYVSLQRHADAEKVFGDLQKSANPEMVRAATAALLKLKEDLARAAKFKAQAHVFDLARDLKHAEVVAAVNEMEQQGPLPYAMQMQRLYAWSALHEYAVALAHADQLAAQYPATTDLALLRADLLAQLGRRPEAETLWRRIGAEHPGTSAALEATGRLQEQTLPSAEDRVFALVRQNQHREAIRAIDRLEQEGTLSWLMAMQRVYSLQALGDTAGALQQANQLATQHPDSTDLALVRADLLIRAGQRQAAAQILQKLKKEHPDTPAATAATQRLHALPPVANLDQWGWGEAYASGDYLGRYGTVVGSGFARWGTFLPHARWLQPYAEHRFGVDTRSGVGTRQTIVADNAVGFYGGLRAQLFETEYLFVYGQGGINQDLLDRRAHGDWALDYQAGVYGFKSWGPGTTFHQNAPGTNMVTEGEPDQLGRRERATTAPGAPSGWRGDWFGDAGGDFSYYDRYRSWIGYGQAHEGVRLFQFGPRLACDAYLVENVTWDVRGNYFDNFFEIGPGGRLVWRARRNCEIVLRAEWLKGCYFGRDDLDKRGHAASQFDGVHVGLSVGVRW